jgi:hypothetical protein
MATAPPTKALVALVIAAALAWAPAAETLAMFARPYRVELVTTGPDGAVGRGALLVGDRGVRLEGSEGDVPYIVIYRYGGDATVMHLLDPVSTTFMTVRFSHEVPVELDLLLVAALVLPPDHPEHPCARHPEQALCRLEARERLRGVPVERWSLTFDDGFGSSGQALVAWVSETDRTVMRTAYADGYAIDFVEYEFGPQPTEAFEVPAEYQAP